jgi:hypothetical protein
MRTTRFLLLPACGFALLAAQANRRLAGDATPPSLPAVHSTGCPATPAGPPDNTQRAPTDFVELQRLDCFGQCPAYRIRIQASGQLTWMGEHYVQAAGASSGQVNPGDARALIEKFRVAGFWNLCRSYSRLITDAQTAKTIVHAGNQEKLVTNYAEAAPDWLPALDREIDALADTHHWIHGDSRTERFGVNLYWDAEGPKPGLTPLMQASARGRASEIQALIAAKADPNARDASGWTALMYASLAPQPEVVQALLDAGANPILSSFAGQTAVMAAAMSFYEPQRRLQSLLAAGADVNKQDQDGKTALMYTLPYQFMHPEVIAFLLQAGARADLRDARGLTARDYLEQEAARRNDQAQVEILRQLLK